jgi:hypothetical protein
LREYERKKLAWDEGPQTSAQPKPPKPPRTRLQEGEDDNFLKFSAFLKIVVGNSIRTDMLPVVVVLLRDYLLKIFKVRFPNH